MSTRRRQVTTDLIAISALGMVALACVGALIVQGQHANSGVREALFAALGSLAMAWRAGQSAREGRDDA